MEQKKTFIEIYYMTSYIRFQESQRPDRFETSNI